MLLAPLAIDRFRAGTPTTNLNLNRGWTPLNPFSRGSVFPFYGYKTGGRGTINPLVTQGNMENILRVMDAQNTGKNFTFLEVDSEGNPVKEPEKGTKEHRAWQNRQNLQSTLTPERANVLTLKKALGQDPKIDPEAE